MPAVDLSGSTILVTGVTGQVAAPMAVALSASASVIGAARFSDPSKRAALEAAGVTGFVVVYEPSTIVPLSTPFAPTT